MAAKIAKTTQKTTDSVLVAFKDADGEGGNMLATERTFSTGSRGFYGSAKIVLNGKRYQVSTNIVEIGSKPKAA